MFGPINIAGIHDGFFDEAEEHRIIKNIEDTDAKLVFVALRCAKNKNNGFQKNYPLYKALLPLV